MLDVGGVMFIFRNRGLLIFLMSRRPPMSTQNKTSAASDVYKRHMEDLRQSLAESCDSIKLFRIRAAYYVENVDVQMNADDILKCYDTFEWLVERLLDIMQSVFYRVSQIDDALRISVHIVSEADLRGFMLERPELKVQQEDENEWFIRCIVFRKRGGR